MTTDVAVEMITVVIDGFEVTVPKGTLIIRAAEKLGIQIPRFCDHPLLAPAGAWPCISKASGFVHYSSRAKHDCKNPTNFSCCRKSAKGNYGVIAY